MNVLITGGDGQLAHCIYDLIKEDFYDDKFIFANKKFLDISDKYSVQRFFEDKQIDIIINCAAYTNVEAAENDIVGAFNVNAKGVHNLVVEAEKRDIVFIHISTDYVYDSSDICNEDDKNINPLSIYAQSKRDGELYIEKSNLKKWFIFRTSWLYSEYEGNFVTNIIKRANNLEKIYGVIDEYGCPTYARSLANFIINFISNKLYKDFTNGIYNYSNAGYTSRRDFIQQILKKYVYINVIPITQEEAYKKFNLIAPRPKLTILGLNKIIIEYCNIIDKSPFSAYELIPNWQQALEECLNRYDKLHKDK